MGYHNQAHYYTPEIATQSQQNISSVSDLESHHDLFTDSLFGPACEPPIRHSKVSQLEDIKRYSAENAGITLLIRFNRERYIHIDSLIFT
jgi:hypothetical protein